MYATLRRSERLYTAWALADAEDHARPLEASLAALEDQVCAEAGLWSPDAARRALAQSRGDVAQAVALVRVWAATLPQLPVLSIRPEDHQLLRRVSATFAEVPGGQWLGASRELASRLLSWDDGDGKEANVVSIGTAVGTGHLPPTRASTGRVRDVVRDVPILPVAEEGDGPDPARAPIAPPIERTARLAALARGETGALVALASLALANRREAVLVESTNGVVHVRAAHPRTGRPCLVAEAPVVEAEAIVDAPVEGRPGFAIGWGASLGTIERRATALAVVDGALQADGANASVVRVDTETVMATADGLATTGFVEHLRLPHYASFASYVDQVRHASESR